MYRPDKRMTGEVKQKQTQKQPALLSLSRLNRLQFHIQLNRDTNLSGSRLFPDPILLELFRTFAYPSRSNEMAPLQVSSTLNATV